MLAMVTGHRDELVEDPALVLLGRRPVAVSDRRQQFLFCHLADASSHAIASPILGNGFVEAMRVIPQIILAGPPPLSFDIERPSDTFTAYQTLETSFSGSGLVCGSVPLPGGFFQELNHLRVAIIFSNLQRRLLSEPSCHVQVGSCPY